MAEFVVVAVRDSAVDAFMNPFFAPSAGSAIRAFADEVSRDGSEMFKHPSDYELFALATWDSDTGRFVGREVPASLCRAVDVKGGRHAPE